MSLNQKKKQPNKWLVFLNIPIQMGVIIFAGVFAGSNLDTYFATKHLFTIVLSLAALFLSFFSIYATLKKIEKSND